MSIKVKGIVLFGLIEKKLTIRWEKFMDSLNLKDILI